MIVRRDFQGDRYNFLTPPEFSIQVGVNFYGAGDTIKAHTHLEQHREIKRTQEFIFVRSGRVRLRMYDDARRLVGTAELSAGDGLLLVSGGHGFDVLEQTQFLEAKQGPFSPTSDKVTFEP